MSIQFFGDPDDRWPCDTNIRYHATLEVQSGESMIPESANPPSKGNPEIRRVGPISLYILISRILGLFRDILLTSLLGSTATADALRAALRIPVMLRDMFSEGALSASFSPAYRQQQQADDDQAPHRFARAALSSIMSLTLVLLALLTWQADKVIDGIFPGLTKSSEAISGLRALLPYLALIPFMAVFRGILHCHRRDTQALKPQIFQNLSLLACGSLLLVIAPDDHARAQGWIWAFLGGAVLGLLIMLRDVFRAGPIPWPTFHWRVPGHGRFLLDFGALLISQILIQSYSLLAFHLASGLETGSLTCLETAFRFHFFPIALIGVSSGIVAGDESADLISRNQKGQLSRMFARNQRLTAFIGFLAGAGLLATAGPIIDLLFVRGRFTDIDGQQTAGILAWYCLAVPFAALNVGLQRTAITLGQRKAVLFITLLGLGVQALILLGGELEVTTDLIAQSYLISSILSWLLLQGLLRKTISLPRLRMAQGVKLIFLSILVHQGAHHFLTGVMEITPAFPAKKVILLAGAIVLGVSLATFIGRKLKMTEVDDMWEIVGATVGRVRRRDHR